MPTYDYVCDNCGNRFELVQRFSDQPLQECPVCHAPVRRVIHSAGIIFKGSGWYTTDYARRGALTNGGERSAKGEKGEKKGEKGESESPAAKTEKAGESKSED